MTSSTRAPLLAKELLGPTRAPLRLLERWSTKEAPLPLPLLCEELTPFPLGLGCNPTLGGPGFIPRMSRFQKGGRLALLCSAACSKYDGCVRTTTRARHNGQLCSVMRTQRASGDVTMFSCKGCTPRHYHSLMDRCHSWHRLLWATLRHCWRAAHRCCCCG